MYSIESISRHLVEKYGMFMTTAELSKYLKYHPKTVKAISEDDLPRISSVGRGGHRYVTSDVARYVVDHLRKHITSTENRLIDSIAMGRPLGRFANESSLVGMPKSVLSVLTKLSDEYGNDWFEADRALDRMGMVDLLPAILALQETGQVESDELGMVRILKGGQ